MIKSRICCKTRNEILVNKAKKKLKIINIIIDLEEYLQFQKKMKKKRSVKIEITS